MKIIIDLDKEMSSAQIAEILGINQTTVCNWIARNTVKSRNIKELANITLVDLSTLPENYKYKFLLRKSGINLPENISDNAAKKIKLILDNEAKHNSK